MSAIDTVLERLQGHKLRPNGRDRWRACCPAHGGSNPTALSIGVGQEGQVLLKCWHGCTVDQVATSLGLSLEDLFPETSSGSRPIQRRALLSPRQCMELVKQETILVWTAAQNLAAGHTLTQEDLQRLNQAANRILKAMEEVEK